MYCSEDVVDRAPKYRHDTRRECGREAVDKDAPEAVDDGSPGDEGITAGLSCLKDGLYVASRSRELSTQLVLRPT